MCVGRKGVSLIYIIYQYPKFGDDRTSFNVIFDVCDV